MTSPVTDDAEELKNFPLLQTRAVTALRARSKIVRHLLSSSPAFRLLMVGSSISMLGTRISTVAFPMLVLHLNKSPFIAGLVTFAVIAPSLLVYVPAGVFVDRWNPRRVMLVSELLRGLVIGTVVVALLLNRMHVYIWFLIVAMVAEEIFEIFSTLADRRYLNKVNEYELKGKMKDEEITSRQASVEVRSHAVVLAGRPVGPFLFSIDPFLPFLADAVSFVASVGSLLLIRTVDEPPQEAGGLTLRAAVGDIGQGVRWLRSNTRALITILLMATTSFVAQALILIFLVEAHSRQLSTIEIGIVLAASGGGGATGSLCSRFVLKRVRSCWLPIQMIAWSVALSLLWLAGGQSVYFSAAAMFILGLTGAIGNIEFRTYLTLKVADHMIAKVSGIGQMLAIGACALGPVLSGYAVQRFQVKGAIAVLLIIMIFLIFASLLTKEGRQQMAEIWIVIYQIIGDGKRAPDGTRPPISATAQALDASQAKDREEKSPAVAYGDPAVLRA